MSALVASCDVAADLHPPRLTVSFPACRPNYGGRQTRASVCQGLSVLGYCSNFVECFLFLLCNSPLFVSLALLPSFAFVVFPATFGYLFHPD